MNNKFKNPYKFIRCEERAYLIQKTRFELAKQKQIYYIK